MDFQPDPAKVVALLVGVEEFAVGGNLIGPALDAAKLARWLRGRGVPVANIKLFLSPTADADHRKEIDDVLQSCGLSLAQAAPAKENDIWSWLNGDLRAQAGDHLFFFWSGHGVIDKRRRHLFCTDLRLDTLLNINFTDFADRLREVRYRKFRKQLLIVDTCANLYSQMVGPKSELPLHNLIESPDQGDVEQFAMMAAAYGQVAKNNDVERTGKFFDLLYHSLPDDATPGWPDFAQALAVIGRTLDEQTKGGMTPVFWKFEVDGEDRLVSAIRLPQASARATDLLAALQALEQPVTSVRRHFHRTCCDRSDAPQDADLTTMVNFLDTLPVRHDSTWPLLEFGYRVACEFDAPALAQWRVAQERLYPAQFATFGIKLQEEADAANQVTHTLVLQVESADASAVQWQLLEHAEDGSLPAPGQFETHPVTPPLDATVLAAALREVIAKADDGRVTGLLAIQLVLPESLLVCDVEAEPYDPSVAAAERSALGKVYPITLRWIVRAKSGLGRDKRQAWLTLARQFAARLRSALAVEWADLNAPVCAAQIDETLRRMRGGQAPVLGLGLGIATTVERSDALPHCLGEGVAYAIWSHGTSVTPAVRNTVAAFFAQRQGIDLLRHLIDLRNRTVIDLGASPPSVKVLWDPPPAATARFGQPQTTREP